MTPPLRDETPAPGEAVPGPAAGAAGEHDAKTTPAPAAATTTADRDLRRLRQATRIPIRFLSPTASMTPPSMALPCPLAAKTCQSDVLLTQSTALSPSAACQSHHSIARVSSCRS